jgi:hypothetical protein
MTDKEAFNEFAKGAVNRTFKGGLPPLPLRWKRL